MRASTVAFCTLTALIIQELPKHASATTDPPTGDKGSAENKWRDATQENQTNLIDPIAYPERLSIEGWSKTPVDTSVHDIIQGESTVPFENLERSTHAVSIASLSALPEFSSTDRRIDAHQVPGPSHEDHVAHVELAQVTVIDEVDDSGEPPVNPEENDPDNSSDQETDDVSDPTSPQTPPSEDDIRDQSDDASQGGGITQPNSLPTLQIDPGPSQQELETLDSDLQNVEQSIDFSTIRRSSPALTIMVPSGFGVDNNTVFLTSTFQEETRFSNESDGAIGLGIGLGDARRAVGVEVSYTVASFGGSRDFGTGGFNLRIHRRITDNLSASVGWRGIITTGEVDFKDSIYGAVTQVFHTRESLDRPFSRIALTAGVGSGQFRTEEDVFDGDGGVGAFGSLAIRVVQPVSLITEWTGQDLAVGLSIAPFKNRNFVITPAVRDLAGGGDDPRFVLGAGLTF